MSGLPAPFDRLAAVLAGDPDAPDDVFTDDAVVVDRTSDEIFEGIDEIREVWAEFAGRRPVVTIDRVDRVGDTGRIDFTVRFRADAHQYAQVGSATITMEGDRIAHWDGSWDEVTEDLAAWDGD